MLLTEVQGAEVVVVVAKWGQEGLLKGDEFKRPVPTLMLMRKRKKVRMRLLMCQLLKKCVLGLSAAIEEPGLPINMVLTVTPTTCSFILKFKRRHSMVTCLTR